MIDGVVNIPKDRWNLVRLQRSQLHFFHLGLTVSLITSQGCSVCTRPVLKKMGGKIQCDRGKCPRAFHVTCAQANEDTILVRLLYPSSTRAPVKGAHSLLTTSYSVSSR